jgi:hypothetical protein
MNVKTQLSPNRLPSAVEPGSLTPTGAKDKVSEIVENENILLTFKFIKSKKKAKASVRT